MNPHLVKLLPYPFERLNELKTGLITRARSPHVSLSLGEPNHSPPNFELETLTDRSILESGLTKYPTSRGSIEVRNAIARGPAKLNVRIQHDGVIRLHHRIEKFYQTNRAPFTMSGREIISREHARNGVLRGQLQDVD